MNLEQTQVVNTHFKDDTHSRLGFIRKVYGILCAQFVFTSIYCGLTMTLSVDTIVSLYQPAIMYTVIGVYFASFCAIMCCFGRVVPTNYILLGVFTLCVSYIVGIGVWAVGQDNAFIVLEAALMTAAMTLGLTIYAMTTKTDFTLCAPFLMVIALTSMMFFILSLIFGWYMNTLYCYFGIILMSFYIVIDTQMIIGGNNRKYQISEDDYIMASVILYLDIINLFLYILQILSKK